MTAGTGTVPSDAIAWARKTLEGAVRTFLDEGVLSSPVVETKPSWGIPPEVLLGMLREQGADTHAFWLIVGNSVRFDYVPGPVAKTPRDAARHFALKWQLDAARLRQARSHEKVSGAADAAQLERQAEWLYRLVADDSLWQQSTFQG